MYDISIYIHIYIYTNKYILIYICMYIQGGVEPQDALPS